MDKKLYRSRSDFMIGGVCGGLGKYLRIDSQIIRIFFTLWLIFGNLGGWLYLLLWLLMPPEQLQDESFQWENIGARFRLIGYEIRDIFRSPNPKLITFVGVWLIGTGAVSIFRQFTWPLFEWWNSVFIWPTIMIIAGIFIIVHTLLKKGS